MNEVRYRFECMFPERFTPLRALGFIILAALILVLGG